MADTTVVNYDDLERFRKQFRDESEEFIKITNLTRQMVHELEDDWIGLAASNFMDEFENDILPAMVRLHKALAFASETLYSIMKVYDEAELDSASYFDGGSIEDDGSGIDVSDIDFGAGEIGSVVDGGSQPTPTPSGDESAAEQETASESTSMNEGSEEAATSSGGGGGGGGGSSEKGLKGDLEMGVGAHSQSSSGGDGAQSATGGDSGLEDHIYDNPNAQAGTSSPGRKSGTESRSGTSGPQRKTSSGDG